MRFLLITACQGPNYDPQDGHYNDILIRLQSADDNGIKLETRLSQTTASLQSVVKDLSETQKALYEEHRNRLAYQNSLLLEQQRHRECFQAYHSIQAQCQPLTNQVFNLTASNQRLQQQMNEKDRILASKEKGAWFRNEANLPWKPSEQGPTLPSIVHSLTASNLHLHQGFNGRNATSTADRKQFGAKYDNWRSGPGARADVAAGGPNTWPNPMEQASHSDKGRDISLRIADINQEQANLTNEQHKDLCAASDRALERGVRLQEVAPTSPTLDSPEEFYDGLPSTADLEDDESKVSSETEAEVDPAGQGRQFKRARTMRRLRPKDPNMVVNCG